MCTIGTDRTGFSPASRNCSALPPPYLFHRPPQKNKKKLSTGQATVVTEKVGVQKEFYEHTYVAI